MGMKKTPIKASLHSSAKAISNNDINNLTNAKNTVKKMVDEKQSVIDNYNFNEVFEAPMEMNNIQLAGTSIIVKLFKENYVKSVEILPSGEPIFDAYISQIDGRKRQTDSAKWIDTPLPYIHAGVIIAISPMAKAHYLKEKNDIATVSKELSEQYVVPEVGTIVDLTHFNFSDVRYYPNKQERDFIKNPEEFRIVHFDGCVKIHPSYVDGVITDKESFLDLMSPYDQYLKWQEEVDSDNV
jgi:hypothetical protein